ncbi:MAG TPA: Kdo hydroxylase family protein [Acidobacteriaceae bacterium]
MPLATIPEESANPGRVDLAQARHWCARLEAGEILYFPRSPIVLSAQDVSFLRSQHQTGSGLHKNIAYKPNSDTLSGLDTKTADAAAAERLRAVMQRYSRSVEQFLKGFLLPYKERWQLDYASFRPQEEQGRDLPLRRRNDLLHTDAFPTRPTYGARILRFFNNLHPSRTRDWIVSDPFGMIAPRYAPQQIPLPKAASKTRRTFQALAATAGLGKISPGLKRSPYDDFMMRFHNFLKENASFQAECPKYHFEFPAGSSWMVYTDTVPHAVLAGQFALEQTFLIDHRAMVTPESSPLAVLEAMTHTALV